MVFRSRLVLMLLAACSAYKGSSSPDAAVFDAAPLPDAGTSFDAEGVQESCSTLSPWLACTDFEVNDPLIRWVERVPVSAQTTLSSPGANSKRALSIAAISPDGGDLAGRTAGRDVVNFPAGARLAFDIFIEGSSTGSYANLAAILQNGANYRSDFLIGITRTPSGSYEWIVTLAQDSAGVPYKGISLKATLAPNIWRHVEMRANPTWTELYVAFDRGPEFGIGASAGISPIAPGDQSFQVGLGGGSQGTWNIRLDNLVVRSP
jgi:hypothetical protein